MRRTSLLVLVLLLALPLSTPAGAQLVNGSFEPAVPFGGNQILPGGSTAIPGWVTTDTGVEWFNPVGYGIGPAPDGQHIVDLTNYVYSAGGVQQTFATTTGASYTVLFYLGSSTYAGRSGFADIQVSAAATTQSYSVTNPGVVVNWKPCSFTFVANAASSTLKFRCLQNASLHFAFIDAAGLSLVTPAGRDTWGAVKRLYR